MERVREVALLCARGLLGIVFIAHGKLKLENSELGPASFEALDIPLPEVSFWFTSLFEVIGGAAFIVGLALPLVGPAFAGLMLGALYFVHRSNGFWAEAGGYEYVLVLAFMAVAVGFAAHRWSLDELILNRRQRNRAGADPVGHPR